MPDSATLLREAAGGDGGELNQTLGRPTGSSGVIHSSMQENPGSDVYHVHAVSSDRLAGVDRVSGVPPVPDLGHASLSR